MRKAAVLCFAKNTLFNKQIKTQMFVYSSNRIVFLLPIPSNYLNINKISTKDELHNAQLLLNEK